MLTPLLRKSNAPLCFLGPSFVRSVVVLFFKLGRGRGRCGRSALAPGSRPFDLRSKKGRRRGPFLRHRTGRRIVSRREGGVRGGGGERGAGARRERGAFETGGGGGLRGTKGGIRDRDGGRGGTERGCANALVGADERTCDRCGATVARVVSWCFPLLRRGRSEPRKTTRATVAPHARLRTVGSRTIHGTEVRWPRNVGVDDDDGGSCGLRMFVFFVCNGDDVLETVSSMSSPSFLFFLAVFVVSFVSSVDDLASVGHRREHDESS